MTRCDLPIGWCARSLALPLGGRLDAVASHGTPPRLGVSFPCQLPAPLVAEFGEKLELGGADELWVIEDCFFTTAPSLAATVLARTERLTVGLGILPAVARNAAITAMELATLASLAPGRLIAGIGHGVQEWMGQIGVRPDSPVTALTEVITAVRQLLAGEEVTTKGSYVSLDRVKLDHPPVHAPPVLAGVRAPRSLAAAGQCADGLILAEMTGPSAVRQAIATAAPDRPFRVVLYSALSIDDDRRTARRGIAPWIAEVVTSGGTVGLRQAPFYDELHALVSADGADGLVEGPDDWWTELGAVGDPDDIAAHVSAMGAAGVDTVSFFPPPFPDRARRQLDQVLAEVIRAR